MRRRHLLVLVLIVVGMLAPWPSGLAQQEDRQGNQPADLAAMPVLPGDLAEPGYQLMRGGYLTVDDAEFLIARNHALQREAVARVVDSAAWQQGYTQTLVLLEDRSYRTSAPLAMIETTILAFENADGAELVGALLAGSPPESAESLDPAVEGAVSWRTVTSQDDRLVTVVRSGRMVFEIVSADATATPQPMQHAALVESTLERIQMVMDSDAYGLSHRIVTLDDDRLVPIAIATESPLVHRYYRLLDDQVIPVAGELPEPSRDDLPDGSEQVVVSRQTAELASQTWLTAGVVVIAFDDPASAAGFAEDGMYRDPLDIFALDEVADVAMDNQRSVRVEGLSGESRVGSRYSGHRVTVRDGTMVAQLTVRVTGNARLDRHGVEQWAAAQEECLAEGECGPTRLNTLLATPDAATPVGGTIGDGVYRSPVAPWSVRFNPEVWQVEETVADDGYDYLYLRSERMDATFETIVDQQGDPVQCVLNELDRLRDVEDRASITISSDAADEAPGGLEHGHGWVIYTVEPLEPSRSDEEYTLRIDCYTVVEGSTSLVVQVRAPRNAWADVSSRGDALRAGIEIDGFSGHRSGSANLRSIHRSHSGYQTPRRAVMGTTKPWTGKTTA